jgi:hypothetical protein
MGKAFLLKGDLEQARRYLELAEKTVEELGWGSRYNRYCHHLLCHTLLLQLEGSPGLPDAERRALIDRIKKLLRISFRMGKLGQELLSAALIDKGIFEWLRGRPEHARKCFVRGIKIVNPVISKDYAVNAYLQAGRYLVRGTGDLTELGRSFLVKCIELAEENEMKPFSDAARTCLADKHPDAQQEGIDAE